MQTVDVAVWPVPEQVVQDEHVGLIKLLLCREFHAALALCAALIEHGHPFLQKLREIMRTGTVGFFASADEDAERLGGR